jgi:multisubunit Na+/H+ antiporter MnhC subunit
MQTTPTDHEGTSDMTAAEVQIRMLVAWTMTRVRALQDEDSERGDGILVWVVMTAILVAAAITIVAIIVTKATNKANDTNTQ